jgi:hypothetical protein
MIVAIARRRRHVAAIAQRASRRAEQCYTHV